VKVKNNKQKEAAKIKMLYTTAAAGSVWRSEVVGKDVV